MMLKRISIFLLAVMLFWSVGASAEELESKYCSLDLELWEKYDNDTNRFETPEEFLVEVDRLFEEISLYLGRSMEDFEVNKIHFTFKEKPLGSWIRNRTIWLVITYFQKDYTPLATAVTHMAAGETINTTLYVGLMQYLQERFGGNPAFFCLGGPVHKFAKEFVSEYPEIIDYVGKFNQDEPEVTEKIQINAMAVFYHSFVKYLIEEYGIEKFMKLYDYREDLSIAYDSVYGKTFQIMKAEWIAFLDAEEPFETPYVDWVRSYWEDIK